LLGDDHLDIKRLFFVNETHLNNIDTYLNSLKSADFVKELVYEHLKLAALRDLKRRRFLRALWASAIAFSFFYNHTNY
jgi:hypothetical protein